MILHRLSLPACLMLVLMAGEPAEAQQFILPRPNPSGNISLGLFDVFTSTGGPVQPIGPVRPSSPSFNVGFTGSQFMPYANGNIAGTGQIGNDPFGGRIAQQPAQQQVQVVVTGVIIRQETPPGPQRTVLPSRPPLPYPPTAQSVLILNNGTRVIIVPSTQVLIDPSFTNPGRVFVRGLARQDGSVIGTYVQIF
jgi:hypothetical protein